MEVKLGSLVAGLSGVDLRGDPSLKITAITADSRRAGPGVLFVAVKGTGGDGHQFVDQALEAGSEVVAVMEGTGSAQTPGTGGPTAVLVAKDTRNLPALLARNLHDRPDEKLYSAAVTGTNGKTTVSTLLQGLLGELYGPCGLMGTIRYDDGATTVPAPLTTPGGPELYDWLGRMVGAGCRSVAMELSSHGLDQGRAAGLELDVAVMTNLGRDHLDYHGDMATYLAAKARIMDHLRSGDGAGGAGRPGVLVLNGGDPAFADLDTGDHLVVRFRAEAGPVDGGCDLQVTGESLSLRGTRLELDWRGRNLTVESALVGRFNAANLTAALAAGLALGFEPEECCRALGRLEQVPGRLERILLPNGGLAVVDYAHTHDALAAVLGTCDELSDGRLLVVFGCGGDRDRGKRPLMGEVAARGADLTWITSDNPRSEDPDAICADILAGHEGAGAGRSQECTVIVDRTRGIEAALAEAREGDVVVVAGKGHEDYQLVGDRVLDLDDRKIIRDWVAKVEYGDE